MNGNPFMNSLNPGKTSEGRWWILKLTDEMQIAEKRNLIIKFMPQEKQKGLGTTQMCFVQKPKEMLK